MDMPLSTDLGEPSCSRHERACVAEPTVAYGELTLRGAAAARSPSRWLPARRPGLPVHQLIDITAVDYPERAQRFDVVYHLLSMTRTSASG